MFFVAGCPLPIMDDDHADPDYAGAIHHLELCATDLDASIDFWDWLLAELGYEHKNDWEGGRSWRKGPSYIVLKQSAADELPFDRGAAGLNHIAFHARSRAQIDDLTDAIRSREDAHVLYEEQHPYAGGYYALYCEDPGGIKVELVGPR